MGIFLKNMSEQSKIILKDMSKQSKIASRLYCLVPFLAIITAIACASRSVGLMISFYAVFNLTLLSASIFLLTRLYKAWEALQSLPSHIKHVTPGQAIGFLFIPLFNYYWGFVAFCKVSTWGNILLNQRGYIPSWPFLTHCILCLSMFFVKGLAGVDFIVAIIFELILSTALCITDIFVLYHIDRLIAKFQKDKALY